MFAAAFAIVFLLVLAGIAVEVVEKERRRRHFQRIPLRVAQHERRVAGDAPRSRKPFDPGR